MGEISDHGGAAKFEHLVVDTSAFIKNVQLQNFADKCYTVRGAIKEIRSNRQMKRLVVLPYHLEVREADPELVAKVAAFAKKTGDFATLSKVDIEVMALAYELHQLHVGAEHLRHEPKVAVTVSAPQKPLALQGTELTKGFYMPKNGQESGDGAIEEPDASSEDSADEEQQEQVVIKEHADEKHIDDEAGSDGVDNNVALEGSSIEYGEHNYENNDEEDECDDEAEGEDDDDDDDDEGWITPSNIARVKRDFGSDCLEEQPSTVACMTTDYAMQNVLKQIGLHIAALDGRVIRQARTYILRCYACFKTTTNVTKTFCPRCGHNTLKKVAISLDEDGQQVIHINSRRPLTAKFKNRPVAKFEGGKHSANPLICEDQPLPMQRVSRKARNKTNTYAEDYTAGVSPFVMRDIDSRSAVLRTSSNIKQQMKNLDYDNQRRGYMK